MQDLFSSNFRLQDLPIRAGGLGHICHLSTLCFLTVHQHTKVAHCNSTSSTGEIDIKQTFVHTSGPIPFCDHLTLAPAAILSQSSKQHLECCSCVAEMKMSVFIACNILSIALPPNKVCMTGCHSREQFLIALTVFP